jgi:hypothetical protein
VYDFPDPVRGLDVNLIISKVKTLLGIVAPETAKIFRDLSALK